MSDVDTTDKITPEDVTDNPEPDEPDNEPDAWTPPDKAEYEKIKAKADKASERDKLLREAQAKIKKLENPDSAPEPTEADKLRHGVKRTAARAVLVGAGITEKKDQATILEVLSLDGVEVDDSGEVDTDELETRVSELRRIFGSSAPDKPRVPRVHTRDKGGPTADPADPDAARYGRFLTGRPL